MGCKHLLPSEKSAERAAFVYYLRTGRRLPLSAFDSKPSKPEAKFNPYHDPRNGRFTFAPGGSRSLRHIITSHRRQPVNLVADDQDSLSASWRIELARGSQIAIRPSGPSVDDADRRLPAEGALQPANYRPNPRARSGGNARAFQDPMTLQQVFPGLSGAPAGAILAVADNILDIMGPANQLTAKLTQEYSTLLIRQIQVIDPAYSPRSFGVPSTFQGQVNEIRGLRLDRAEAFYRKRGETRPLQVETLRFLQERVDAAYVIGLRKLRAGRLKVRLSPEEALGNYIDRAVRNDLRDLYNALRISTEPGQQVRVIGREYDTSGTDRTYRIPDARVGKIAFDVTLTRKTLATQQIRGFFNSDFRPDAVVIVRPSQLGAASSYAIIRPRN